MGAIPSALNKPGDMIALTDKLPVENPIRCRLKVRQVADSVLEKVDFDAIVITGKQHRSAVQK